MAILLVTCGLAASCAGATSESSIESRPGSVVADRDRMITVGCGENQAGVETANVVPHWQVGDSVELQVTWKHRLFASAGSGPVEVTITVVDQTDAGYVLEWQSSSHVFVDGFLRGLSEYLPDTEREQLAATSRHAVTYEVDRDGQFIGIVDSDKLDSDARELEDAVLEALIALGETEDGTTWRVFSQRSSDGSFAAQNYMLLPIDFYHSLYGFSPSDSETVAGEVGNPWPGPALPSVVTRGLETTSGDEGCVDVVVTNTFDPVEAEDVIVSSFNEASRSSYVVTSLDDLLENGVRIESTEEARSTWDATSGWMVAARFFEFTFSDGSSSIAVRTEWVFEGGHAPGS